MIKKAIKLINKADWETLLLMAGYLFNEKFLKGHLIASINLANEKEVKNFIEFFGGIND